MNFNNGLLFLAVAVLLTFSFSDAFDFKQRKLVTRAASPFKSEKGRSADFDEFVICFEGCLDDTLIFDNCAELLGSFRTDVACLDSCATSNPEGYFEFTEFASTTPDCASATSYSCTAAEACAAFYEFVDSETEEAFFGTGNSCPSTCAAIAGDGSLASSCLAGDMKANVINVGDRLVEDIQIGDMVHVGEGKYEPVLWQTQHRTSEGLRGNHLIQATFVEIEFENGNKISLTPNHFTITDQEEVLAGSVKVGDVLDSQVVVDITRKYKTGAYNPQTLSQKIEVNGAVVSTRTEHSPPRFVMTVVFTLLSAMQTVLPTKVYTSIVSNFSEYIVEPALFGTNIGLFSLTNAMVFAALIIGASRIWKKV